jgi:hypothetical protein
MHMTYAKIENLTSAAAYVATVAPCWQKPSGLLRPDENQALTRRRSR